jgi:hypothetical protein
MVQARYECAAIDKPPGLFTNPQTIDESTGAAFVCEAGMIEPARYCGQLHIIVCIFELNMARSMSLIYVYPKTQST